WRPSFAVNGSPANPDTSLPTISPIAPQTIAEDTSTGNLAFTVGDVETPASALVATVLSNNLVLLPPGTLTLGGSGADRTLRATPAPDAFGSALITVIVTDADGASSRTSFHLTVMPVAHAPVSAPESYTTDEDTPLIIPTSSGV